MQWWLHKCSAQGCIKHHAVGPGHMMGRSVARPARGALDVAADSNHNAQHCPAHQLRRNPPKTARTQPKLQGRGPQDCDQMLALACCAHAHHGQRRPARAGPRKLRLKRPCRPAVTSPGPAPGHSPPAPWQVYRCRRLGSCQQNAVTSSKLMSCQPRCPSCRCHPGLIASCRPPPLAPRRHLPSATTCEGVCRRLLCGHPRRVTRAAT